MGRAKKFSLIRKGSIYFFKLFFLFKNTIFGNTFLKPFFFFFFAENYTKCILLSKDIFLLPLDVLNEKELGGFNQSQSSPILMNFLSCWLLIISLINAFLPLTTCCYTHFWQKSQRLCLF